MAALCRLSRSTRRLLLFSLRSASSPNPNLNPKLSRFSTPPFDFLSRSSNHSTIFDINFISNSYLLYHTSILNDFTLCQKSFFSAYSTLRQGSKLANAGKNDDDDDEQLKLKNHNESSWIDLYLPRKIRAYVKLARLDKPIGTWLLAWPCM
ncbi:4-hydroxybenzoate polyprenyltransferase mitochondrial [Bienertia sinuspersici]